jgi:hypothetical protein
VRKSASARSQHDETGAGDSARWILVLPLAALCAAIAYGASAIALTTLVYALLGPAGSSDPAVAAVASAIASGAMAYIFVWTAAVIAPSSRVRVVQALIVVGTVVAAIAMYDPAIASSATGRSAALGSLACGAGFIAGLVAAGFSLRRLRD